MQSGDLILGGALDQLIRQLRVARLQCMLDRRLRQVVRCKPPGCLAMELAVLVRLVALELLPQEPGEQVVIPIDFPMLV